MTRRGSDRNECHHYGAALHKPWQQPPPHGRWIFCQQEGKWQCLRTDRFASRQPPLRLGLVLHKVSSTWLCKSVEKVNRYVRCRACVEQHTTNAAHAQTSYLYVSIDPTSCIDSVWHDTTVSMWTNLLAQKWPGQSEQTYSVPEGWT